MTTPTLIIEPELRNLLPPLSKEELTELEANIQAHGCLSPLIVWENTVIDGHNRYEICTRLDIHFDIKELEFKNISEAKLWIWQHQKGRRSSNAFLRGEMVLTFKDAIVAQAKARQRGGQGGILLCQKSDKAKRIDTKKILAKSAEISHDTLVKIEFLLDNASEEVKKRLRGTKKETSINKEYNRLKAEIDAKTPPKPKKPRKLKPTSPTSRGDFGAESRETADVEKSPKTIPSLKTPEKPDQEPATPEKSPQPFADTSPETITVTLKTSPKINERYCCGVQFEPDPDDDFFDWITDEERAELFERRKTCPNRLVPQIHNFTIQNIPEHKPDQLINCLFSLFKPNYRKKLLYALAREMRKVDGDHFTQPIINELFSEFQ